MPTLIRCAAIVLGLSCVVPNYSFAQEENFQVSFGGSRLGSIIYNKLNNTHDFQLSLDNTPFGVFDGTYSGRTFQQGTTFRYEGRTRSNRKARDVSMLIEAGLVQEVSVSPSTEMTDLSSSQSAPSLVLDVVSAFGHLLEVEACPEALKIYDGRRVGLLSLREQVQEGSGTICRADYRVVAGPGYLEPLGLSHLVLELTYDTSSSSGWHLYHLKARSGVLGLSLTQDTP